VPFFGAQKEAIAAITVSSISQGMDEKRRREIVRLVRKVARAEDLASLQIGHSL